MVDFNELLGEESKSNDTDPLKIFKRLEKTDGKEFLRSHQEKILTRWHNEFFNRKDTIVKLHTGQGKTLVGLLMLQSSLNAGCGPALFVCPNSYLVKQTMEEAKSFGIKTVEFPENDTAPPREFLNSEAILVANCYKLFNGKSIFGVIGSGREVIQLGAVVMDDVHRCVDIIRDAFSITVLKKSQEQPNPLYQELWNIFQTTLMRQGAGTCADVIDGRDSIMAVPFWSWSDKQHEVLQILSKYKDSPELLFVWDLLKDKLGHTNCIFSGKELQISPRLIPVDMIPSFANATRRIFLSATLTEDASLVKDLNVERASVTEPLSVKDDVYSGERMVLIPSLLHHSLTREKIIEWVSRFSEQCGDFGVVALVPSFSRATDWKSEGATVTNARNLEESISTLKQEISVGTARHVTVLVNEYDGVDLPDGTCRLLCLDSVPVYASLSDIYLQETRPNSFVIRRKLAQRLEQGVGRAIRGPNDWCIIVMTGIKLSSFVSDDAKRKFLTSETQMQIKVAELLAEKMKSEEGHKINIIENLVKQCIDRDPAWKEFYKRTMDAVTPNVLNKDYLEFAELERLAESYFQDGQHKKAVETVEIIITKSEDEDAGWYFQLMATYLYPVNPTDSMDKQIKAFSMNNQLQKPENGVTYSKLANSSMTRENSIIEWIKKQESHSSLIVELMSILDSVSFDTPSESFENGILQLGQILGFPSQRPEKSSGSGPDNLWNLTAKQYWIISCKNMVKGTRDLIHKHEASQLISDITWFEQNYDGCKVTPIFIHPAKVLDSDAFLNQNIPCFVITPDKLEELKRNILNFFNALRGIPFENISSDVISKTLGNSHLDMFSLRNDYLQRITPS